MIYINVFFFLFRPGSWPVMREEIKSFLEELKSYQRDQFEQWSNNYLDQLNSRELSLDTDKQVIYFERGKDMKVCFTGIAS